MQKDIVSAVGGTGNVDLSQICGHSNWLLFDV